ncbi:MAG: lysophospholipid acyltransferase family protein [Thermodesulfobacteriota bacterium]|nr:lysophospholipid acyltransferase family protein [Thermodesulfobacteriota bacterium]
MAKIKNQFIRKITVPLINLFSGLLWKTLRIKILNQEGLNTLLAKNEAFILAGWHENMFFLPLSLFLIKNNVSVLVSPSHDGKTLARVLNNLGMNTVKGSSRRGGYSGFKALERNLRKNQCVSIALDGPQGPRREIKRGTILLAKHTGKPILPIIIACNRYKVFEKTWDRFFLPYPFAKTVMIYGNPVYIPENINKENLEGYRDILKEELRNIEEKAKTALQ